MALTQGQLNYWKKRTGRQNLTMGQAAYQRAQAKAAPKPPAPPKPSVVPPATRTWLRPNASGLTGQQQLWQAWKAKNPGQPLPEPAGGIPPENAPADPNAWQDAGYWNKLGQLAFQRNQRLGELDTEGQQDKTNFQESLRRFREMQPRQEEQATNSANRAGLLYSGILGRELGDIRTNAIRQEADMQGAYDNRERARAAARQALQDGATLEEAAAAAEAVDRQTGRDSEAAGSRSLVRESLIPTDNLDAGVDVGTPSPKRGGRKNTNRTPSYLPRGYANWSKQQRSRYWARRRKARR